jgi:hypothetical protein
MPGMIVLAGQLLDDARDAGQRPEIRAEAMRARALAQGGFDAAQLLRRQPGLPPGAAGGPQRRTPALAPRPKPSHDALATHRQAPGDGPLCLSSSGKQPRRLLPTNFQSMEISAWGNVSGHAPSYAGKTRMSLYYARLSKELVIPKIGLHDIDPARCGGFGSDRI